MKCAKSQIIISEVSADMELKQPVMLMLNYEVSLCTQWVNVTLNRPMRPWDSLYLTYLICLGLSLSLAYLAQLAQQKLE